METMTPEDTLISVGEITNTHGVKGEVRVRILTDFPERFVKGSVFQSENDQGRQELTVEKVKPFKNVLLVKFRGIDDLNQAEALKGALLKVKKDQLKELGPDTYYVFDIIGMEVVTEEGQVLGQVRDVVQTGSNDVYVVTGESKEFLIPALKHVVKQVDKRNRRITIQPLEGLLDL